MKTWERWVGVQCALLAGYALGRTLFEPRWEGTVVNALFAIFFIIVGVEWVRLLTLAGRRSG